MDEQMVSLARVVVWMMLIGIQIVAFTAHAVVARGGSHRVYGKVARGIIVTGQIAAAIIAADWLIHP